MNKNCYIMGFMGCGKSSVGKKLAALMNRPFLDTDTRIEETSGKSIPNIFKEDSEPVFRQIEKEIMRQVTGKSNHIISLGGGAMLDPENWEMIRTSGITISLMFSPEIILKRLENDNSRPLLDDKTNRLDTIKSMMMERDIHYRKADLILSFNRDIPVETISTMIRTYLESMT